MKKVKLIALAIALVISYCITAQVAVNTDGSSADGSAILDVSSTSKGFLPPRMTQSQIEMIENPANGLTVFNTDDNRLYFYVLSENIWKEIASDGTTSQGPAVGDFYDGGVVFYLFISGDPGYVQGETHGLICAISNQADFVQWFNQSYIVTGATGTAIGTGQTNTSSIISSQGVGYYAAQVCVDCGDGNWFLPSEGELNAMCDNKTSIDSTSTANGGSAFAETWYWSSTETSTNNAYIQDFGFGNPGGSDKNFWTKVRAIRYF